MVPPRDDAPDPASGDDSQTTGETDGGAVAPALDEERLYGVVRAAVEDAILGALGTVLLSLVGLVVAWVGVAAAVSGRGPAVVVAGAAVFLFGAYLVAATLGVIPTVGALLRGR